MCAGVRNEGWFDPWALLFAFKKKVVSLGVQHIEGTVSGLQVTNDRVESVQVSLFTREFNNQKCTSTFGNSYMRSSPTPHTVCLCVCVYMILIL